MGSLTVVVIDVLPKNQSEVTLAEAEQPTQVSGALIPISTVPAP